MVVNTAEDVEVSGLHVSPDLDTVVYTLAGIVNEETWYGVRGDTFRCHEMLKKLGHPELLRIGDQDRAVKLYRTLALKRGKRLSEITRELCRGLGVRARVMPMSDDRVKTLVHTDAGLLEFHEFWVARRAKDRVLGVSFEGANEAEAAPGVLEALEQSEAILLGPSNPITSIGPILAIREIGRTLQSLRDRVTAVSPIIGGSPVSGPAGVLMRGLGHEVSPLGVARIYQRFAQTIFIDRGDEGFKPAIEELGIEVKLEDLLMPDLRARVRLARALLAP